MAKYTDYYLLTDKYLLKISIVFAFALLFLFFSIMFSLGFMIEKESVKPCTDKFDTDPLYNLGRGIHSKAMAEKVLKLYTSLDKNEAEITYIRADLEPCGAAFLFVDRSDNVMYAVCESGKIHRYVYSCS